MKSALTIMKNVRNCIRKINLRKNLLKKKKNSKILRNWISLKSLTYNLKIENVGSNNMYNPFLLN